jgi:bisphosphoglycerate-independent phosphoglycerate mutase (AlkP superfamily)
MKMRNALKVQTQYLENYGAHSEDGKYNNGNAYWKFKGGDEIIVFNYDKEANAVALVAALVLDNQLYHKEFPRDWVEVDVEYLTDFEKYQFEEEGKVRFPSKRIDYEDRDTWKKGIDFDHFMSNDRLKFLT